MQANLSQLQPAGCQKPFCCMEHASVCRSMKAGRTHCHADYRTKLQGRPDSLDEAARCRAPAPFYLNGWRAFSGHESLADDCPNPMFAADIDQNGVIMEAVDHGLFRGAMSDPATSAAMPWWEQIITNLTKVRLRPCYLAKTISTCTIGRMLFQPKDMA